MVEHVIGDWLLDTDDFEIRKEGAGELVRVEGDEVVYVQLDEYPTHGYATYLVICKYPVDYNVEDYEKYFNELVEKMEALDEDDVLAKMDIEEEIESFFKEVVSYAYTDEEDLIKEAIWVVEDVLLNEYDVVDLIDYDYEVVSEYYGDIYVQGSYVVKTKESKTLHVPFTVTIAYFKNLYGNEIYEYTIPDRDDVTIDEDNI